MKNISANIDAIHTKIANNFILLSKLVFLSSKTVEPIVKKAALYVIKNNHEIGMCKTFGIGTKPININNMEDEKSIVGPCFSLKFNTTPIDKIKRRAPVIIKPVLNKVREPSEAPKSLIAFVSQLNQGF